MRYALAAGLEVVVAMPPDTPAPILLEGGVLTRTQRRTGKRG